MSIDPQKLKGLNEEDVKRLQEFRVLMLTEQESKSSGSFRVKPMALGYLAEIIIDSKGRVIKNRYGSTYRSPVIPDDIDITNFFPSLTE
jgi:hypothetical protein